jgi:hypothetical protein
VRFSITRIFIDFYTIKSLWEGDFGVKMNFFTKYVGVHFWGRKIPHASLPYMLNMHVRNLCRY